MLPVTELKTIFTTAGILHQNALPEGGNPRDSRSIQDNDADGAGASLAHTTLLEAWQKGGAVALMLARFALAPVWIVALGSEYLILLKFMLVQSLIRRLRRKNTPQPYGPRLALQAAQVLHLTDLIPERNISTMSRGRGLTEFELHSINDGTPLLGSPRP